MWNNFIFLFFRTNIGIGQESTLSPILPALYIFSIFHIFEKKAQKSFLKFGCFFSIFYGWQSFYFAICFCSYNIITSLFDQIELIVEHGKLEIFYFSRLTKYFYLPSLDLTSLCGPILQLKDTWKYLGFIFNKKLFFYQYIHYYSCKALSMIKGMKMLGNSMRGLLPYHKWL